MRSPHQLYPSVEEQAHMPPVVTRHIIYIQGFFPKGPAHYHALLAREAGVYAQLHGVQVKVGPLQSLNPLLHRSMIEASQDGQTVNITYDFLDWHDLIHAAQARGFFVNLHLAVHSIWRHLVTGAAARLWMAHWRYAAVWIYPYACAGVLAGLTALGIFHLVRFEWLHGGLLLGLAGALLGWGRRHHAWLMACNYTEATRFAQGQHAALEARLAAFAETVSTVCAQAAADEIVLVGHSFGAPLAVMTLAQVMRDARARQAFGRLKMLTLGDISCHIAALEGPGAQRLRGDLMTLAAQRKVPWVLMWSGKDVLNFDSTNPACFAAARQGVMPNDCGAWPWPLMFNAHFRGSFTPRAYKKFRWRFFRVHSQFIYAARVVQARFDYLRVVCGPRALVTMKKPSA